MTTARFAGTCKVCDRRIKKGAQIAYVPGMGAVHPMCASYVPGPQRAPQPDPHRFHENYARGCLKCDDQLLAEAEAGASGPQAVQ